MGNTEKTSRFPQQVNLLISERMLGQENLSPDLSDLSKNCCILVNVGKIR
ncbi:MAG: hypothetical protein AAF378_20845 [Cyanobacteria bacterium P01_A01_bin.84]